MKQNGSSLNLGILTSGDLPGAYSATFIKNQIDRLPARVFVLYGGGVPNLQPGGRSLIGIPYPLSKPFFIRTGFGPLRRWQNRVLAQFFRREQIQAVLAEYGTTGAMVTDGCLEAGVPLIVHFHGYDAYIKATIRDFGQDYKKMFQAASAIIAVSTDMMEQLFELGAPREKLHQIPYGIDTTLFSRGDPAGAPPLFIQVGRFVEKKAPHLTLSAFKQVVQEVPEAKLVLVGNGPLLERCKQQVQDDGISDSVEFAGVLTSQQVAQKMAAARAYVQHSIRPASGDSEGTPLAVLEAGATGLPVVATRHGGIKDAVIEDETGYLVDERDVDAMARHMIDLAQDPELAGLLGRAARKRIEEHYSLEKQIRALWLVIEEAVKNK